MATQSPAVTVEVDAESEAEASEGTEASEAGSEEEISPEKSEGKTEINKDGTAVKKEPIQVYSDQANNIHGNVDDNKAHSASDIHTIIPSSKPTGKRSGKRTGKSGTMSTNVDELGNPAEEATPNDDTPAKPSEEEKPCCEDQTLKPEEYKPSDGSRIAPKRKRNDSPAIEKDIDAEAVRRIYPSNSITSKESAISESGVDRKKHTLNVLGLTGLIRTYKGNVWQGFCFRKKMMRPVVSNISLHVKSGEITAVLGNSGCGKTSMLDAIAHRFKGKIVGGVYLDNYLFSQHVFQIEGGYVMQDDHFLPHLTVRETIAYRAILRYAGALEIEIMRKRGEEVLEDMGLKHIANSIVGGAVIRGISGGEKRRLSIAVQLLQDPRVLLLDEPTTGLDSFTAHYLMENLVELAKVKNKIIMLTIHQPRSDIFYLFDAVAILASGELVYYGPRKDLVPYFNSIDHPCPAYVNPLDHYVDLASIDHRSSRKEQESHERVNNLKRSYIRSKVFRDTLSGIHTHTGITKVIDFSPHQDPWKVFNPPGNLFFLYTLVARMMLNLKRDKIAFAMRFVQLWIFSFFMWILLFELKNNQESIQDRNGLFFQTLQVPAYIGLINACSLAPVLRDLYKLESRDGLYGSTIFLTAYFLHILPFSVVSSFGFSAIIFWSLGLGGEWERFPMYFLTVLMMHLNGELLALALMGIFDNMTIVNSSSAIILALSGLVATGFLKAFENMNYALRMMSMTNIFKYAAEILVANEYEGLDLYCQNTSLQPCLFKRGDDYLAQFYPNALENKDMNVTIMAVAAMSMLILAMITFKIKSLVDQWGL